MRPSPMTTTRSAMVIASRWSWVTTMVVMPSRCCSWRSSTCMASRSLASSADSGSSSRNSFGESASARAIATRWRWPPESLRHRPVGEAGQMDELRAARRRASAALPSARRGCAADRRCCRRRVRCGNSASDWNTMPKLRLCVGTRVMSSPSRRIAPAVGSSSPAIMRSSVVLPQPDGPSRQTKVPCGTVRLTSSTAVKSPKCLVTSFEDKSGHARPLFQRIAWLRSVGRAPRPASRRRAEHRADRCTPSPRLVAATSPQRRGHRLSRRSARSISGSASRTSSV